MVTLTLNDGTTIAGLSMEHDTFYSPTEITAAMLDGKLSPVRIALSKDDNDGLINQAWTGTIEYAAVQSITQVNGKWAIKLKKISGWKALAEKQTVKYLRVNTLITPMSITKCYMTKTSFQEGSNPLFITFPATGSKGKDYQVKITATVTNYQGYASTYGMKTVHYYGSSGYSLQFIEALSDTGSCINIADNTIHINSGWNGTTIPCYGNVIVEQFFPTDSIPYGKNKQDKPIYTLNDEIWKEITSFTWN